MNLNLLIKFFNALIYLICSFILGILLPFIVSCIIILNTDLTFTNCFLSIPFILFSLIGIVISSIYLSDNL